MNRNKQKGTRFESEVVDVFKRGGFPHCERRAQSGNLDRGDLTGVPGWVIECKNTKAITLGEHLGEAEREAVNAAVDKFTVVHKRRMKGAREAFATVPLWLLVDLIANDRRNTGSGFVSLADDFLDRTKDIA